VQVVALDDEVAAARLAAGQLGHISKEVKRDLQVVVDHRVFADPVQGGHGSL
jgi:hypothetical protein